MNTILRLLMIVVLLAPLPVVATESNTPDARWGHVFVYFPPMDSFILFGGASERGTFRDDMWQFDGQAWRRLDVPVPQARGFAAAAYDAERELIIVHGGRGDERVTYSDLWAWDGVGWQQLEAEGPFKSDHHEMVFVPEKKGLLLFGGWTGNGVSGETWYWTGNWEKIDAAQESPPPRSAFGMTYNTARNRVEIFGGLWINGQYADSWAWKDGLWNKLSGPYENSSLDHLALFFDASSGETMSFGGKDYRYVMRGETRRMDAAGIVQQLDVSSPSPRHSVKVAFDTRNNQGWLFGGKEYSDGEQIPLDDLWRWENGTWHLVTFPVATQ